MGVVGVIRHQGEEVCETVGAMARKELEGGRRGFMNRRMNSVA